jgi:hypothetical protein
MFLVALLVARMAATAATGRLSTVIIVAGHTKHRCCASRYLAPGKKFLDCRRFFQFQWIVDATFSNKSNRFATANLVESITGKVAACQNRKGNQIVSSHFDNVVPILTLLASLIQIVGIVIVQARPNVIGIISHHPRLFQILNGELGVQDLGSKQKTIAVVGNDAIDNAPLIQQRTQGFALRLGPYHGNSQIPEHGLASLAGRPKGGTAASFSKFVWWRRLLAIGVTVVFSFCILVSDASLAFHHDH